MTVWTKSAIALLPLLLAALVTIAWQNSHALVAMSVTVDALRIDMERIERNAVACAEPRK